MHAFRARGRLALVAALALATAAHAAPAPPAAAAERVVVALGDSLTAGWGVAPEEAWPAQLEARLRAAGFAVRVINAGVSGDTSAGGLARLESVLRAAPALVIVALGANDGLRGVPPETVRANLTAIVARLQARGVRVLLTGMRVPPNYGPAYAEAFAAVYADVARRTGVPLVPFLLEGVAADPRLNQADGIHPSAAGHRVIADRLAPTVQALVAPGPARPGARAGAGR